MNESEARGISDVELVCCSFLPLLCSKGTNHTKTQRHASFVIERRVFVIGVERITSNKTQSSVLKIKIEYVRGVVVPLPFHFDRIEQCSFADDIFLLFLCVCVAVCLKASITNCWGFFIVCDEWM